MPWTRWLRLTPLVLAACPGDPVAATDTDPADTTAQAGTASESTTAIAPTTGAGSETTTESTTSTGEPTTAVDPTTSTTQGTTTTTTETTTTSVTTDSTTTTDATDTGVVGECVPGDMQDCYSGPDGTLDVGECHGGQKTCGPEQLWGPCLGEVVPARDTCEAPGDESCDGLDPCQGDGAYAWGLTFGEAGNDEGDRVAFDGEGNLVLAAWSNGDVDFGGGPLVHAGYDVLLAKFAPDGALLWAKRFGDGDYQGGPEYGLAIAGDGDIVLGGVFHGDLDFGGGPLKNPTAQADLFLARLDGDGQHQWSHSFHSGDDATIVDLAIDPSGDILLTGAFVGSLALGGPTLLGAGANDLFVAKFTGAGAHAWSRGFGDPQWQIGMGIGADAAGDIYVTGGMRGSFDPGTGPLVSAGLEDIFLIKFDPSGAAKWGKRWGDVGSQAIRGLAVDSKGRVSLTGGTSGVLDFGGGPLEGPNVVSYLAQFDGDGAHLWSRELCEGGSIAEHVAVDGLDNLAVIGTFYNSCDLGGGPLMALDNRDVFVAKFGPLGQHGWSKRLGGPQEQRDTHVAAADAGSVAATGHFNNGIDLGAGNQPSHGGRDGYVVVLDP
ncbi:hypothetical protein [Nannocystis bainbridge]|uniref:Uncharacterized protein n=1 Tax=Nannocystis bainbridge TaxID=2995303 RepID=A0ABT5E0U3_9BACT|nr:hypothetical protein [Nannocystis bainbridge]MDC0719030.1 hypothetical protein [Nannocystis bainbridge]